MVKSFNDIERYFENRQALGIKPGLERMDLLLEKLGNPERKIQTIHVAGTNGKGSTVQMIADPLIAHDYKVGIFSSPSFTGLAGHFLINGQSIGERDFVFLMNKIIPIVEQLDERDQAPTEFEILTALAFLYFAGRVDLAIIEAGMGGRLDTTNCMTPIMSVITSIAYDHEQFLGNTLEKIAHEKAGIIKQERPVIIGPISKEAKVVIGREAEVNHAPIYSYGTQFFTKSSAHQFTWESSTGEKFNVNLSLSGAHQIENAAIALMVLVKLDEMHEYEFDWDRVTQAISKVTLPGRFEQLVDKPKVIVDSAHNSAGIEAFIQTAKHETNIANACLLFAGFRDKRIDQMINHLLSESFSVTLTTFNHERAAEKADFINVLEKERTVEYTEDWQSEIREFLQKSSKKESLFITGSLHFVMRVRQFIKQYVSEQHIR